LSLNACDGFMLDGIREMSISNPAHKMAAPFRRV
jgi:hypothetical protein